MTLHKNTELRMARIGKVLLIGTNMCDNMDAEGPKERGTADRCAVRRAARQLVH